MSGFVCVLVSCFVSGVFRLLCLVSVSVCFVWVLLFFFFSSRRRHTRCLSDWSSDVCSSDLGAGRQLVFEANIGEGAADHYLVITAASAVGVEILDRDAVLDQILARRALRLDKIGRASCRERV